MQSKETDRVHMGDKDWSVKCYQCKKMFEATRSDATFCSPKCRVAYSRHIKSLPKRLEEIAAMNRRVLQLAEEYRGELELIAALERLKTAVGAAEFMAAYLPSHT